MVDQRGIRKRCSTCPFNTQHRDPTVGKLDPITTPTHCNYASAQHSSHHDRSVPTSTQRTASLPPPTKPKRTTSKPGRSLKLTRRGRRRRALWVSEVVLFFSRASQIRCVLFTPPPSLRSRTTLRTCDRRRPFKSGRPLTSSPLKSTRTSPNTPSSKLAVPTPQASISMQDQRTPLRQS